MESALDLLRQLITSPLVYLLLFALTAVDAVFPMVPAETAVITAAVLVGGVAPELVGIWAVATLGAMAGDHASYLIGRGGGARRLASFPAQSRRRASSEWARRALHRRGGLVLTSARYVPGGRTAVTLTMGAVRYPLRSFLLFDAIGGASWALYSVLLGYFGGLAFQQDPLRGVLAGLGLSIGVTALLELGRRLGQRSRRRAAARR
ncbi:DedA family protein [Salinispora arenicola]|uniref:Membrane protein n=2 Tax=Salinispora arenicola TaxID=168697 RepID=A0A542XJN8_SALAC|nr:DedA family protein [Salinispora arenicola]MCN0152679.1 DedA family protein [Salinispora arenicola]NIL58292.1 DedA family protein [Salinispora arenicola]NIL63399.1 DedA family protein [Salinispora arenicola]TQL36064.1 membrane protein DedA with SNARE-associated domain [Salinispora arenicola]GIM83600.1 membrane protein [Salinispora arenicola]